MPYFCFLGLLSDFGLLYTCENQGITNLAHRFRAFPFRTHAQPASLYYVAPHRLYTGSQKKIFFLAARVRDAMVDLMQAKSRD